MRIARTTRKAASIRFLEGSSPTMMTRGNSGRAGPLGLARIGKLNKMKTIKRTQGRNLIKFRNCFCGVQAEKFSHGSFLCLKHWQADRERSFQDPKVTEANIRESNARSEKNRYAKLKAAGLCVTCGKRPNYFGCIRCETCQAKRRELHYASRGRKLDGPHPWKIANDALFTPKP